MRLIWSNQAWEDYLYWQQTDKQIVKKINKLIKDIKRDPFNGIGKPEPLKYQFSGFWSKKRKKGDRLLKRQL